ncbi:c-type cytochrome [Sedimenticola selenatireducens]|uniref:c-type cytochrome n=1 Tax=Sedimenticola selenatireducens TaxID=191960 RepID=UPI0006855F63|nr:cytochrome c [Sedimenticola selenatireducens]
MMLKKNRATLFVLFVLLLFGLFLLGEASAHGGATGVVKERMELMKSMGDQMKKMGAMVKGKETFDAASIAVSAQEIKQAAPEITHLFPEGSSHNPSEALPRIWEERGRFDELTEKMILEAGKLSDLAIEEDRRSIVVQFTKLGKTCSACHTDFRKKQEE